MQAFTFVFICVTITSTFAQLQIGQYAKNNENCKSTYENRAVTDCNPKPNSPICAVISNSNYVYGVNFCYFCIYYGNSSALVVDIGKTENECSPFNVGDIASNDPYCMYFYNRSGPKKICTREGNPICALLNGKVVTGWNKCDFCSNYGDSKAEIISIGTPCTTT